MGVLASDVAFVIAYVAIGADLHEVQVYFQDNALKTLGKDCLWEKRLERHESFELEQGELVHTQWTW